MKTCHPYFYNQLYHGADEYGLAGSWLSDALNTNIHTFEVAPAFIAIEHHLLGYIRQLFGWSSEQVFFVIIIMFFKMMVCRVTVSSTLVGVCPTSTA